MKWFVFMLRRLVCELLDQDRWPENAAWTVDCERFLHSCISASVSMYIFRPWASMYLCLYHEMSKVSSTTRKWGNIARTRPIDAIELGTLHKT